MKCSECGEHRSDFVNQFGVVSFLVMIFCFGWIVRHNYLILDLLDWSWEITARIITILGIGAFAFLLLAALILWADDR